MDSLLNYSIVTGSSKGLGKSFAEELASRGNHLILVALPGEGLKQLSIELSEKYDVEVLFYETDFSKQEAVYQFADWINSKYSINILVNNVGIGGTYSFLDSNAEYIDSIININVRTFSLLTRLLLENLRQQIHSYVLNVASMASFSPMPYKTVYPASKAFIYSFSRSLSEELKNTNIFVSVVHPGPMMTNERVSKLIIKQGRLGRFGLLPTDRIAEIAINKLLRKKPLIIPGILNKITWIAMKTMPVWFQLYLGATLTQKELDVSINEEKIA